MIGLMPLTLREPRRAFARLRGLALPLSARWGLVVMAAAASAVLSFLADALAEIDDEGLRERIAERLEDWLNTRPAAAA